MENSKEMRLRITGRLLEVAFDIIIDDMLRIIKRNRLKFKPSGEDESIQRMRWREGYDKPPVWMESGKVYKVVFLPLITSNFFDVGHRLRVEISSSSFPEYERNLNTGGNNYDETAAIAAHNAVHHSARYPSALVVTVMKRSKS